jgi:hypothetical protein|mmetsp:Transcript_4503/g.4658  ORF Transcript_4503/g.4658 Transcript_4503/m.4658 type:complete len:85 (-) Transcript_4503:420-674(-)|eukprot:CAMPEP_0119046478 /NCGR_PEP_ID=MMETSP1177-20130426/46882_1 /TAXON_ID=2985 /ORGANISM="Ochromonas sp, Strain CCMP1899" /LENGTH=84 /DNA_ID=CAMNT_0007019687 /DNA_START=546 /DNA_END=800 /DNA_ORIENTATION=+
MYIKISSENKLIRLNSGLLWYFLVILLDFRSDAEYRGDKGEKLPEAEAVEEDDDEEEEEEEEDDEELKSGDEEDDKGELESLLL